MGFSSLELARSNKVPVQVHCIWWSVDCWFKSCTVTFICPSISGNDFQECFYVKPNETLESANDALQV